MTTDATTPTKPCTKPRTETAAAAALEEAYTDVMAELHVRNREMQACQNKVDAATSFLEAAKAEVLECQQEAAELREAYKTITGEEIQAPPPKPLEPSPAPLVDDGEDDDLDDDDELDDEEDDD